jgi:hypothetical protein
VQLCNSVQLKTPAACAQADRSPAPAPPNFLQKMNRIPMWSLAPSGLSQSTIGIKGVEEFALNWKFIFVLEAGLDRRCAFFAR